MLFLVGTYRLQFPPDLHPNILSLVQDCLYPDYVARPSAVQVKNSLEEILILLQQQPSN